MVEMPWLAAAARATREQQQPAAAQREQIDPVASRLLDAAHILARAQRVHDRGAVARAREYCGEPRAHHDARHLVIMAVQHVSLPMAAVQFHPESILTRTDLGLQMLRNALSQLRY